MKIIRVQEFFKIGVPSEKLNLIQKLKFTILTKSEILGFKISNQDVKDEFSGVNEL